MARAVAPAADPYYLSSSDSNGLSLDRLPTSEQPAVLESLQACHKRKPDRHEYLSKSAFSNLRALSTDFTALRLRTRVGVLLLPLPRQFV
jgi:hypothetical protein